MKDTQSNNNVVHDRKESMQKCQCSEATVTTVSFFAHTFNVCRLYFISNYNQFMYTTFYVASIFSLELQITSLYDDDHDDDDDYCCGHKLTNFRDNSETCG